MEKKIYNYRVIIEPDVRTGTNEPSYTASVPTLGIATDGDSIEEALNNAKEAIAVYLESLIDDGLDVPQDTSQEYMVATTKVKV